MAVYTTITEKVQYTDVDSHLSNCIGGGEDYRSLSSNTKNIYGGILAIRGWYGSDISQLCKITSVAVHLEGVCENTNFKCDCDFTTLLMTSDEVLAGNTPFTVGVNSAIETFDKTFSSGSWQNVDNTVTNPTMNGMPIIANACFFGVKLVFWNGNKLTSVKCKVRNVTISITRTRACYIVFKGEGITFSRNEYEYGTIPSYGSVPTRDGYTFKGWSNGTTTYNGTLPAANDYDTEYTAVWEKKATYTITYNVNAPENSSASGSTSSQTCEEGNSVAIKENAFKVSRVVTFIPNRYEDEDIMLWESRTSYATFLGWFTDTTGGTQVSGNYTPTGNVTLYAHWSDFSAITPVAFTKEGFTHDGWWTAASGGTKIMGATEQYVPTSKYLEVYAHWASSTIKLIYLGNKAASFYLGQKPVSKIFKGNTEIYYDPFAEE